MPDTKHFRPQPSDILWKLSWSLLLLALLLFGILWASWTYILPRFTAIAVSGSLVDGREVPAMKVAVEKAITAAEEKREALMRSIQDPLFRALTEKRNARTPLSVITGELQSFFTRVTGAENIVHLESIRFTDDAKKLEIKGDVRNVEGSSMTVLAKIIAALKALPFVQSISAPSFVRLDTPGVGLHSPFTITMQLQ